MDIIVREYYMACGYVVSLGKRSWYCTVNSRMELPMDNPGVAAMVNTLNKLDKIPMWVCNAIIDLEDSINP